MPLIQDVLKTMNTELERIVLCLERLTEEQVWYRCKPNMNSIGNLCLHLAGNEYQQIVSAIGNKPNIRERSAEFTANGNYTKERLIALLRDVRSESARVLAGLHPSELDKEATVYYSAEDWNRMKARNADERNPFFTKAIATLLVQVAEHYGYHAGQIVLLTKLLQTTEESVTGYTH
jgi:hypothetical protein